MKIAFYFRDVRGGIRTHVKALSHELEKFGHEVKKIDQFSLGSHMVGNYHGGISYGFDFSIGKIKKEIEDCDILHIHHAATFSEFFLPFSSICSEINVTNTFHIPIGNSLSGELAKMPIVTLAFLYSGHSKKFISVSAEVAKIIRRYTNSETETVVIPNGVDVNRFHPLRRENGNKEDGGKGKICIGYLGRLSVEKNIINLIRAVKALKSEKISLKIAGSGPLYEKIKMMEDERVKVLGYVEDAASFYQSIDVFLLPSKMEAQPLVLLEAMASGLPIITTSVGDNKYLVDGNGILCGTSKKEICDAIQEMMKEDMEKMGLESREIIEQEYAWDKIAFKTLKVYKSI